MWEKMPVHAANRNAAGIFAAARTGSACGIRNRPLRQGRIRTPRAVPTEALRGLQHDKMDTFQRHGTIADARSATQFETSAGFQISPDEKAKPAKIVACDSEATSHYSSLPGEDRGTEFGKSLWEEPFLNFLCDPLYRYMFGNPFRVIGAKARTDLVHLLLGCSARPVHDCAFAGHGEVASRPLADA